MAWRYSVRCGLFLLASWLGIAGGSPLLLRAEEPAVRSLKFSKRCLFISPNEGCAVADFNRDGKLDIVSGPVWFAAPDYIPRPLRDLEEFQDDFYHSNGDLTYDVDGDGWIDVIAGDWLTPEIFWYQNPGEPGLTKGMKWKKHLLVVGHRSNEAYDLHDFDGDGIPELFVNCYKPPLPQIIWKFTKDAAGNPTLEEKKIGESSGHGYAFGDVNGDGREDVLVESGWLERPAGDPWAGLWKFHPESALPHTSAPSIFTDLNGDGRGDIIFGRGHDYGLFWWEQGEPKPDGTTTWTEHVIDTSWASIHFLVWTDLDGDGQCELIGGKRVRAHVFSDPGAHDPECLFYYTWDKATQTFTRHPIADFGEGVGGGMQIRVADLNGDGRPDVVTSGKTGTWILMNEGFPDKDK